jgi:hypothetical protein
VCERKTKYVPSKGPAVHAGEEWAYRKRAVDTVTRILVVRVGKRQPPRVLIRFLDDSYEGREEWVPPGRLVVEWSNVEAWQAREDRWERVALLSEGVDGTAAMWAAAMVFEVAASEDVLCMLYNKFAGVLCVSDPATAAQLLDAGPSVFLESESAFIDEDGTTVIPWTTALRLAQSAAPRYADAILEELKRTSARLPSAPSTERTMEVVKTAGTPRLKSALKSTPCGSQSINCFASGAATMSSSAATNCWLYEPKYAPSAS